jgi:hypothetical protein
MHVMKSNPIKLLFWEKSINLESFKILRKTGCVLHLWTTQPLGLAPFLSLIPAPRDLSYMHIQELRIKGAMHGIQGAT